MPEAPFGARRPRPVPMCRPPPCSTVRRPPRAGCWVSSPRGRWRKPPRSRPPSSHATPRAVRGVSCARSLRRRPGPACARRRPGRPGRGGGSARGRRRPARRRRWPRRPARRRLGLTTVLHAAQRTETTAALAERLAYVCEVVAAAALARRRRRPRSGRTPPAARDGPRRGGARGRRGRRCGTACPRSAEGAGPGRRRTRGARGRRAGGGPRGRGRLWVVAPGLGVGMAGRLTAAVAELAPLRGAPLVAAAGVAVHPADGRQHGSALAARAEERLYEARAAGVPVA